MVQNHATPLLLIRDAYESTVLTSFFYLLLLYLSPDPDEQRMIFSKVGLSREADREARRKDEEPKKWVFPLGFIKWKPAASRICDCLLWLTLWQGWSALLASNEMGSSAVLCHTTDASPLSLPLYTYLNDIKVQPSLLSFSITWGFIAKIPGV